MHFSFHNYASLVSGLVLRLLVCCILVISFNPFSPSFSLRRRHLKVMEKINRNAQIRKWG